MNSFNICRACLSSEERVQLLNWYQPIDTTEYFLTYKECFCKCTQINLSLKIDHNDSAETRTQYLCFDCAQKLKEAYEFIEKAKRADNELRCIRIEKVKLEDIENSFEWVPVDVKESKIDRLSENCIEDIKVADVWNESSIVDESVAISEDVELDENSSTILANKRDNTERSRNSLDDTEMSPSNGGEHTNSANIKLKKIKKRCKVKAELPTPKSFKRKDELVNCEVCGKSMTRNALRKHKVRHKPKTFLCQACPKTFSEASGLKTHELSHRENRERYPCDKCNQTFSTPYTYKRHVQTHENNRKPMYQCTQCDKSFLHKSGLTIHELHHKGATKECNICQKRYVRQIDLETHLRTHSGESPFECHICGKSFIHKRILNRHLQYHEGYFSYNCLICDAKFSKYDQYYSHRMQHTGLPYKCGSCEKQFPDAYKTKRHIRGVHKVEQDKEVEKLVVRINVTKEYRGRIVEVLKNPEDEKND